MSDTQNIETRVETLEEQVEALVEQNQQLKAQNKKVSNLFQQFKQGAISRRAFMTSVAALGGVGYAAGSASAAPDWGASTGNVGEEAQPLSYGYIQDLHSETFSTERITSGAVFAGGFSGADADARLDNAISASNFGEVILLENGSYDDPRTISKDVTLIGTKAGLSGGGTEINAEWTLDSRITLKNATAFSGSNVPITVANRRCILEGLNAAAVTVNADEVLITKQFLGSVTFDSATSGGLVSSSVGTTANDPGGNNTIGDIS